MKRFLINTLLVAIGVCLVDVAAGFALDYLWTAIPKTQDIGKARYAREQVNTDIVIVGSSRAAHHYDAKRMADSLKTTVYNVGLDGCFFLDNMCVMHTLLQRYAPRTILLEIAQNALTCESVEHLEGLYLYYWKDDYAKQIIDREEGWSSRFKLCSNLYRYNANSFKTIGYGIRGLMQGQAGDPLNGYVPNEYVKKRKELVLKEAGAGKSKISTWKSSLLDDVLGKATKRGVKVIVVTSPVFNAPIEIAYKPAEEIARLCRKHGFEYWDYFSEGSFLEHPEWFSDNTHLNRIGAEKYTEIILGRLERANKQ